MQVFSGGSDNLQAPGYDGEQAKAYPTGGAPFPGASQLCRTDNAKVLATTRSMGLSALWGHHLGRQEWI